jgi:hypothetical protein
MREPRSMQARFKGAYRFSISFFRSPGEIVSTADTGYPAYYPSIGVQPG